MRATNDFLWMSMYKLEHGQPTREQINDAMKAFKQKGGEIKCLPSQVEVMESLLFPVDEDLDYYEDIL